MISSVKDAPATESTGFFGKVKSVVLYEPPVGKSPPWYLFFKNRYFRAVIFLLMCLMNTIIYYGWQPFSMMLFRAGAYRWLCDESTLLSEDDVCDAQDQRVQTLYYFGQGSELIFGVFSGITLDYVGPWFCGCIGSVGFLCGWMCLVYSTQAIQAYIPGMMLMAGSVNFIAFPCLCIGDLFPRWTGLAVSLVIAAQTTGTAVPVFMKIVWDANRTWSYSRIVWGYLGVCFFPVLFFYFLSVPYKRLNVKQVDCLEGEPTSAVSDAVEGAQHNEEIQEIPQRTPTEVGISAKQIRAPGTFKELSSLDFLLFSVYYTCQLLQFGYYPTTVQKQYGETVAAFQGYILPTQGIWGTLFGLIVDKVTTLPICASLIIMMTLAYVLAIIRSTGLQYLTSVLYVLSNSYIYTVKYTFIGETYNSTHFGVLVGTMGCITGALVFINIPISATGNYVGICIGYIVAGCVAMAIVVLLYIRKKKGIHYRTEDVQEPKGKDNQEPKGIHKEEPKGKDDVV